MQKRFAIALICLISLGLTAPFQVALGQDRAPDASREQPAASVLAPRTTPAPDASQPDISTSLEPVILPSYNDDLRQAVERIPLELARLQKAAARLQDDSEGVARVRTEAEGLRELALATIARLEPLLPLVRSQIDRLGPAPKDGEPPEPEVVKAERDQLNRLYGEIDGSIRRLRLSEGRTGQLLSRLQSVRHRLLARDLFSKAPSPMTQELWSTLAQRSDTTWQQISAVASSWWRLIGDNAVLAASLLLASLLAYLLALQVRAIFVRARLREIADEPPPIGFFRRTRLAAALAPAYGLPRLIGAGVLAGGIYAFHLYNSLAAPILLAIYTAFTVYVVTAALSRAVLMPQHPPLRLVGVSDSVAHRSSWIVRMMALVAGVDIVVATVIQSIYLPATYGVAASFIANVLFAVLLLAFLAIPFHWREGSEGGRRLARMMSWLRLPIFLTAVVIVVASLLGYLSLARFIVAQVMILGMGGLAVFLGYRAIDALIQPLAGDEFGDEPLHQQDVKGLIHDTRLASIVRMSLNVVLGAIAAIALLLSWGFSSSDIGSWFRTLIVGFEFGQVRISPAQILLSILLFVAIVALTRILQRWLTGHVLTARQMDAGLAHSIHTGVGYAGMALAVLAGVSYAGLDVTNLAIVAGALSVGIGFGLQSIVNNFVSGLILLVERPIKVGDWIVVGNNEGYVRRISVRATEIETFDRASLILPNSELVTGTVQNWTHRNSMGRIIVAVGASYDADPANVIKVLEGAAASCPGLLRYPAPLVVFENLGDSAFEFTVRAFVADVTKSLVAKTELRVAIVAAFREANIEIPFPQQDLHLRDLDGVRDMMARAAANRSSNSGDGRNKSADMTIRVATPKDRS